MGWLGKIVGGSVGLVLGGPLGAIAGVAFGHMLDRDEGRMPRIGPTARGLSSAETAQYTFFVAAFSMLAKLARADGRVSREEIAAVESFIDRDLQLHTLGRRAALGIFQTALHSEQSFADLAQQFYATFGNQPRMLEMMVDILLRVGVADGRLSREEDELIHTAARHFHLSSGDYERLKARHVPRTDPSYAVLGCDPDDDWPTIKRRYRKLAFEYHPDQIMAKGLPEEFVQLANDKFREIQEAYESIKQRRGIS